MSGRRQVDVENLQQQLALFLVGRPHSYQKEKMT
jgi:hypothetical protein